MVISPEQEALIERVFESYLTEHHRVDLLQLVADTSEETHRPVVINAMTLFEANMEVGDYFNAYPSDVLVIFDKVLLRKAEGLSQTASSMHGGQQRTKYLRMRHTPHARITGLPVCPELTRDTIPRSRDVGHFLSVTGTVIRTSVAKVLEYEREYQCAKCRHVFPVQADFEQFYTFAQLVSCPNPDGCNSHKFTCLSDGSEPAACRDYQEIKIQEQVQRLSVGSIPRSVVVVLEDDLADSCKSGDDVTVYGVVCQRWKPLYDDSCCDVELVLRANNIEVNNEQAAAALVMKDIQREFEEFWISHELDPIAGRNQILLSLCPQVFGMYLIKLAVAMVLAGGVQRVDSSGTKIRGECHLLLVGDPGTGKSQFLKYAAKITPRSVLTAGIGSTTAGLTVAAVRDGGEWHLEAGALVLSDGGLCCIDEFNSIKEHDRISIHEAMEQQSISVAKAGMVCKLNTRTSILAASNPKGQYDPNEPLSVNVALASPLLSRFDLVLVLMDTRNAEWDKIISSFILDDRRREGLCADSSSLWSMDKMKAYFSVIKSFKPQVSEDANVILTRYYQLQRQSSERSTARTTIRMLESLSRLAEAHARLMYRSTVTIEDAVMAVSVMECSMQGGALLGQVNALLTSFPADPSHEYQTQCQILLEGLKLPQLLHKEMDRLARLKSHDTDASHYYQHPVREPHSNNNARRHDDDSNCKGDGLDWFHSIPQSLLSDETSTSIITATQENWNRKPNSSWSELMTANKQPKRQSEDTLSNTDVTLASVTQEEIQQSDRQRAENHPEASECVFQKVPKHTRDKRLTEGGARHGDRMGSGDVLESNQNFSCIKKRRLATTDEQKQTGTKSAAVMKKKTAPEADTRPCDGGDSRYEASEDAHRPEVSPFRETEPAQRKPARRPNGRDDAKVLCERQKNIVIAGNETKGNGPTGVTPFKSGHTKSAVASSTLAKLSRFSFTCSSEPTAAAKVEQSQKGSAACPTENPKDKNTLPKRGPREKKMKSAEIMDRGEDGLTCAASELRAGLTHEQRTECTESAPSVQRSHSVPGEDDDGPAEYQHTVNLKKRRCFELDPPPSGVGASRGLFSRLGLFGSVEFSNDALDTDWD